MRRNQASGEVNMNRTFVLVGAVLASSSLFAQSQGPKGYYMTAGNAFKNVIYDAGVVTTFGTSGGQDYPIAVSGDVRTAASGQFDQDHGGQYDLNGNWTGVNYSSFGFSANFDLLFYDGTTDGTSNFVVNYGNLGGVWKTDRDWNNMTKLFDLGGFTDRLGITYDVDKQSLWVSNWNNGVIEEYDLTGNLLSSFDSGLGSAITALAMDQTTGVLWMGQVGNNGVYTGYDRSGHIVDRFQNTELGQLNILGGEFNVVPEPATILALGAGLAAFTRRRRAR